jgi:hypothetical protein
MNLKRRSLLYPGRRFKRPQSPDAEERKERDASQYLEDVEQAVAPYMAEKSSALLLFMQPIRENCRALWMHAAMQFVSSPFLLDDWPSLP